MTSGIQERRFVLELLEERLWCGNTVVPLSPKPFSMLRYFVQHPGRLLRKDEILATVWPDTVVTADSVKDYVHDLRIALGDSSRQPQFIETVRGHGYRYIGDIEIVSRYVEQSSRHHILATALAVDVLPFAIESVDATQQERAQFIAESVRTELCRFRSVRVIADSSGQWRQEVRASESMCDLEVDFFVEGSARTIDDRCQLTVVLDNAATGCQVWADRFQFSWSDSFERLVQIAELIASTVAGRLRTAAQDRAVRCSAESLGAYGFVIRGQAIVADTPKDNTRARKEFEKALELDPGCARGHTGLAHNHVIDAMFGYSDSFEGSLDLALKYALKGAELDAVDGRAQWMLAHVLMTRGEFDEAEVYFDRAHARNPNDADGLAMKAIHLQRIGLVSTAIDCYTAAFKLNPNCPGWYLWNLGSAYYLANQYARSLKVLKLFARTRPSHMRARRTLAATLAQLGQLEEARAVVDEIVAAQPTACLRQEHDLYLPQLKRTRDLDHYLDGFRKAGLPQ